VARVDGRHHAVHTDFAVGADRGLNHLSTVVVAACGNVMRFEDVCDRVDKSLFLT
jgi:hypothetical protein